MCGLMHSPQPKTLYTGSQPPCPSIALQATETRLKFAISFIPPPSNMVCNQGITLPILHCTTLTPSRHLCTTNEPVVPSYLVFISFHTNPSPQQGYATPPLALTVPFSNVPLPAPSHFTTSTKPFIFNSFNSLHFHPLLATYFTSTTFAWYVFHYFNHYKIAHIGSHVRYDCASMVVL